MMVNLRDKKSNGMNEVFAGRRSATDEPAAEGGSYLLIIMTGTRSWQAACPSFAELHCSL